ncbi:transcription factor HES-2 [Pelobates fuscus]|uniref:transcription factor HES-2 n=1 Tax=Pelobates fuscus TaxID=191477 RepID=UPI002FE4CA0A
MAPHITMSDSLQSFQTKPDKKNRDSSEMRKTLKPLMEKRRRARINESLNQLKTLILPLIGKDNSKYSKLEKADILEMTVRFLKDIHPAQAQKSAERYKEGYRACIDRLGDILSKSSVLNAETSSRLLDHLQRSPDLCCRDCNKSPSPKHSSPRIVLHLSPRTAELYPPSLLHQPPNQRQVQIPIPPQPTSDNIWRPW